MAHVNADIHRKPTIISPGGGLRNGGLISGLAYNQTVIITNYIAALIKILVEFIRSL